jgi:hypothetical protein
LAHALLIEVYRDRVEWLVEALYLSVQTPATQDEVLHRTFAIKFQRARIDARRHLPRDLLFPQRDGQHAIYLSRLSGYPDAARVADAL